AGSWYKGAVQITLTAQDALSGNGTTFYGVDNGETQTYGEPFTPDLSTGVHSIVYWSVDLAGNTEAKQLLSVKIDNNPPTITGAATPSSNGFGWNNTAVNVNFACGDAESGIAGCGPDATVGSEGANQTVQGDARDVAGNTSSTTVDHISIDKT
ncbi:MAG TPA: hypothetical protein DCP11_10020, partial [Microbacteriaceae bacterium]|nr:hypothetical protein [Microbacteriaceae bacterium]